jgi:hypothetical protein
MKAEEPRDLSSMISREILLDDGAVDVSSRKRGPWHIYVVAAFPDIRPGFFAIWEMIFRLGSDDMRQAIALAFSEAHRLLDDPVNIAAFGYKGPPAIYAVTQVDHLYELPRGSAPRETGFILLRPGPTLSDSELEAIKSFDKVSDPFSSMLIG